MSHRIDAFYADRDRAHLAAEDLRLAGIPPERIFVAEGLVPGAGRIEVAARDLDEAINVRTFLQEDGAASVEMRESSVLDPSDDTPTHGTIPAVPFTP